MRLFFYSYLCIFYCSCATDSSTQNISQDSKKAFLEQVSLLANANKFKKAFRKAGIKDTEVVTFCRENTDIALRSKMIEAVFADKSFDDHTPNPQFWAGFRYNISKFVEHITILREKTTTFMDVGSGNGEKLFGALCLGFDKVYGLEYNPKSLKMSQKNLQNFVDKIELRQGDALVVEPSYYQKADFIYMYSPIKNPTSMAVLFKRIMENMRDGATLLEVRFMYARELNQQTHYDFPDVKGWFALKKEGNKFFYKNVAVDFYGYDIIDGREWTLLPPQK